MKLDATSPFPSPKNHSMKILPGGTQMAPFLAKDEEFLEEFCHLCPPESLKRSTSLRASPRGYLGHARDRRGRRKGGVVPSFCGSTGGQHPVLRIFIRCGWTKSCTCRVGCPCMCSNCTLRSLHFGAKFLLKQPSGGTFARACRLSRLPQRNASQSEPHAVSISPTKAWRRSSSHVPGRQAQFDRAPH